MPANVFFIKGDYPFFLKHPESVISIMQAAGLDQLLTRGAFTAFKIHFGEKGNKSFINPNLLIPLARYTAKAGAKPFLFETNTLYRGGRMNAIDHINTAYGHQFGKLNIPVIIGDGITGADSIECAIHQKHHTVCYVAQALKDIQVMLVLSHMTGHMLTGFGCAVKNIGMGCASRRGKLAQHSTVSPRIEHHRCTGCGACARVCPARAIAATEDNRCHIESAQCIGCAQCIAACPIGAVSIDWGAAPDDVSERVAEYALAVSKTVRCLYMNVLLYMTTECDCMNKENTAACPDIGIICSADPIAADKASLDMLQSAAGKDILREFHPPINYLRQLEYGSSIGLGSLEYTLHTLPK